MKRLLFAIALVSSGTTVSAQELPGQFNGFYAGVIIDPTDYLGMVTSGVAGYRWELPQGWLLGPEIRLGAGVMATRMGYIYQGQLGLTFGAPLLDNTLVYGTTAVGVLGQSFTYHAAPAPSSYGEVGVGLEFAANDIIRLRGEVGIRRRFDCQTCLVEGRFSVGALAAF